MLGLSPTKNALRGKALEWFVLNTAVVQKKQIPWLVSAMYVRLLGGQGVDVV